jgi:hypothetical protein
MEPSLAADKRRACIVSEIAYGAWRGCSCQNGREFFPIRSFPPHREVCTMNSTQSDEGEKTAVFSPVSDAQIEEVNLRRILAICVGVLAFEIINLFNPNFWSTPILWGGAVYLSAVSAAFLLALALRKPAVLFQKPDLLNALFWICSPSASSRSSSGMPEPGILR